jgi:hypothetical protein
MSRLILLFENRMFRKSKKKIPEIWKYETKNMEIQTKSMKSKVKTQKSKQKSVKNEKKNFSVKNERKIVFVRFSLPYS